MSDSAATDVPAKRAAGHEASRPARSMRHLVLELIRPYRGWLAIVFAAMMVEIAMSLAAPWPLKIVLDDALGSHKLPQWLEWAHDYGFGRHTMGVALFAGVATLLIAVDRRDRDLHRQLLHESVGQWVANDLRIRIYEHLHRLSLALLRPREDRHADVDDHERRRRPCRTSRRRRRSASSSTW